MREFSYVFSNTCKHAARAQSPNPPMPSAGQECFLCHWCLAAIITRQEISPEAIFFLDASLLGVLMRCDMLSMTVDSKHRTPWHEEAADPKERAPCAPTFGDGDPEWWKHVEALKLLMRSSSRRRACSLHDTLLCGICASKTCTSHQHNRMQIQMDFFDRE